MLAAVSYLARYSGTTLTAYGASLTLLFDWCRSVGLDPLQVKRVHLELYVRYLEQVRGNMPASVSHHLTPLFGYYRFAVVDGYIPSDPSVLLRRPRLFRDESCALAIGSGRCSGCSPLRGPPPPPTTR